MKQFFRNALVKILKTIFLVNVFIWSTTLIAETPVYEIVIENHLFYPATLKIPAGQKVKLKVINKDPTPEEFESYELNREKVIMGGRKAIIFVGPLTPGRYPYFGEFNPKTAQGIIVVESLPSE